MALTFKITQNGTTPLQKAYDFVTTVVLVGDVGGGTVTIDYSADGENFVTLKDAPSGTDITPQEQPQAIGVHAHSYKITCAGATNPDFSVYFL